MSSVTCLCPFSDPYFYLDNDCINACMNDHVHETKMYIILCIHICVKSDIMHNHRAYTVNYTVHVNLSWLYWFVNFFEQCSPGTRIFRWRYIFNHSKLLIYGTSYSEFRFFIKEVEYIYSISLVFVFVVSPYMIVQCYQHLAREPIQKSQTLIKI